jgi:hypothetical protein
MEMGVGRSSQKLDRSCRHPSSIGVSPSAESLHYSTPVLRRRKTTLMTDNEALRFSVDALDDRPVGRPGGTEHLGCKDRSHRGRLAGRRKAVVSTHYIDVLERTD